MTPDWVHDVIVSAPPTLAALGVWWQGRRTHRTFNSKMDAMHELLYKSAYAEGVKDQKEAQLAARPSDPNPKNPNGGAG